MKSKKIVAMLVAFASFMAVATSGLAAVTTTTTYNEVTDKVVVDVDVTEATANSEVTYLVKSGDAIVYIDQKTADEYGAVAFDYKIDKDDIKDLATSVQFGTNGAAAITGDDTAIELANVNVTLPADGTATVAFYTDADCKAEIGTTAIIGDGDAIYAKFTVANDYAIDQVTGLEETTTDNVYKVIANTVAVTTKSTVVEPEVVEPEEADLQGVMASEVKTQEINGQNVEVVEYTKVLKVVGAPSVVGVEYNGYRFPALKAEGESAYDNDKLYAVRIVVKKGETITSLPTYLAE